MEKVMAAFVVGDRVRFREANRVVTITKVTPQYVYFDNCAGGYFPRRFEMVTPFIQNTVMDIFEYDDILAGQEIYSKLEGR